ncbi:MAG: Gfo/Idh/MocA family oxidoreductase [Candidatus Obscuribacter sp.]|nr:Gfo/Idh/MocA family oxidoreductase [Candidatus Obscuribacter sp.]MBP6592501.1 Gfo/Idh/MocA family oxidoreductase [Candidatus Obscuribacter sp.]MBP7578620.1 Gfo/Idh/MocA family oxidoreductase [Candidatus Obscuribacter sp.]
MSLMEPGANKVRFAVVGLGHIAQTAVLPAFSQADGNCELTTLISDDGDKLRTLASHYGASHVFDQSRFEEALMSGAFDAIYIALPNDLHCEFAVKAAQHKIHVLCEKPMAISEEQCSRMIKASEDNNVKLMIAYRLHFEKTNMKVVEAIHSGRIGEPRVFNSTFTMQVKEGIRTERQHGGGPLFDIGIYCINASRYLFKGEPLAVSAIAAQSNDPRFEEIEEACAVTMKFPGERLASFTCSFGSKSASHYEVLGTDGMIRVSPAYDYDSRLSYKVVIGDDLDEITEKFEGPQVDQFAPELIYFADCILNDKQPSPSGLEGLADIRIIDAIKASLKSGHVVALQSIKDDQLERPDQRLIIEKPAATELAPVVHAE